MTHEDIVYDRRVRSVEHAARIGKPGRGVPGDLVRSDRPTDAGCPGTAAAPQDRGADRSASGVAKVLRR